MSLLQEILALAEDVEQNKLYKEIDATFESAFDECMDFILAENTELEEAMAVKAVGCMADDKSTMETDEEVDTSLKARAKAKNLKESVDAEFKADVALLESLTSVTLIGVNDILDESFEAAVERILKSDRKLRMKDKDGKPYKTRRRAAEAAVGASMRAVFGKKGMIRKAQAGKKG